MSDEMPRRGQTYQHFKGKEKLYEIIDLEVDSDNNEGKIRVAYVSLYDSGEYPRGTRFSMSLERFCEDVTLENRTKVKRFILLPT